MIENTAAARKGSSAQASSGRVVVYASVGRELTHYDVDVDGAALVKRCSVTLPGGVMYAWPHASKQYLYVASSDRGRAGSTHHLNAFRIDPSSGALQQHGEPVPLRHSSNHLSTDVPSEHVLAAYPNPSGLTVYRINQDGTIGEEVKQATTLDLGVHPHQIRLLPSNKLAILVTRGENAVGGKAGQHGAPQIFSYKDSTSANRDSAAQRVQGENAADAKAERPGALKVFNYQNGVLTNHASVAPGGGYGFGPRHLDFHPALPWLYVSLERQNKLYVHKLEGSTVSAEPLFIKDTVADPGAVQAGQRQMSGTIHLHPNGRFVYVANRAYALREIEGKRVFSGGENSIAVYAINQDTGEPTLMQNADTRGFYPRTFAVDPSGRILVAANAIPLLVKDGTTLRTMPAGLSVFRIASDGKLDYVRKYDVDVGSASIFWMGLMKL